MDPRTTNNPASTEAADHARAETLAQALGTDPLLLERIQAMRESIHHMLHDEFRVVAADLEQLRGILGDAAGKLSSAFTVMTRSSSELHQTVESLRGTPDAAALGQLTVIADGMTSTAGMTVQSLQFEDMASQLLQHVARRLALLENFSKDVAVIQPTPDRLPPYVTPEDLTVLEGTVERYRLELAAAGHKAVQQQSLDSGDIELF